MWDSNSRLWDSSSCVWASQILGCVSPRTHWCLILDGSLSKLFYSLMALNVAKCNLGKVKFKTMPVSGRPTLRLRGNLLSSLLGVPRGLHCICLLACVKGHFARLFSSLFRLLYYQARFFRCDVISSDEQQSFCFPV